jgi:hypothetical protein
MDVELYQEKMDPAHRAMLCRMLNVKVLSTDFLEAYDRVKRMTDRVDGRLSPGSLALIAVIAGYDGQEVKEAAEKKAAPTEAPTMTGEQAAEQVASGAAKPVGPSLDVSADEKVEEKLVKTETDGQRPEQPVSGATGQAPEQPKPSGGKTLWANGMPVNVLQDDELKQGHIAGIVHPEKGSGKAIQLTVELDGGGTITVDEDEAEPF